MNVVRIAVAATALVSASGRGQPVAQTPGDVYELSRSYETDTSNSDGVTSRSNGRDVIVERVVAVRPGGVELVYDLLPTATTDERSRE